MIARAHGRLNFNPTNHFSLEKYEADKNKVGISPQTYVVSVKRQSCAFIFPADLLQISAKTAAK